MIFSSEVLSYIKNWKKLIEEISRIKDIFFAISLFLPKDPIGFIKDKKELIEHLEYHFNVLEIVDLHKQQSIVIFCKTKGALNGIQN